MVELPEDAVDPDQIDSTTDLARALTELRDRADLPMRQVAHRTGIKLSTLSGYYSGRHLPQVQPADVLRRILKACGITDESVIVKWELAVRRIRRHRGRSAAGAPAPYLGLNCYHSEHADWFYGRETAIDAVLARLAENRRRGPVFVVGASGSGKSSLLRAGVIPALAPGGWQSVVMTPDTDPCGKLADELADVIEVAPEDLAAAIGRAPAEAAGMLRAALRSADDDAGSAGLLLVVDEFEELFTSCTDDDDRLAFVDTLCALAEPAESSEPPIKVVIGMRADFYSQVSAYAQLVSALQDNQILLGPMTTAEVTRAIVGPAGRAGLEIEPGLVELLLRDLAPSRLAGPTAGHDSGTLPLLSYALLATWERRQHGLLTVKGYQESGGIKKAIAASADEVYGLLDYHGKELARGIFLRLVYLDDRATDARLRIPLDELRLANPDVGISDIVDRFVARRLLTVGADGVEISHEALIHEWPLLRDWLDQDRLGLREHRQLAASTQHWLQSDRDPAALLRGTRLDNALMWAADQAHARQLNAQERAFLDASEDQLVAEQLSARWRRGRRWLLASIVVVLALVASVLTGYVVAQNDAATHDRDVAQSVQLAEQADQFRTSDVSLAMQLALAAYRIAPTPQASASLLDSVAEPAATRLLGPDQVLQSVAVAHGGQLLATAGAGKTIQLWNLADRRRPVHLGPALSGPTNTVYSVVFSPNGQLLAEGGADRMIRLWDVADVAHPRLLAVPIAGPTNTVYSLAFSPNGRILAAGSADDTIRLWDLTNPAKPVPIGSPTTGFTSYVQSVSFSPNGRLLAAGSADQTVRLWDVTDPAHLVPLGGALTGATGKVFTVAFSPDGGTLATGSADRTVRLWNVTDPSRPTAIGAPLTGATGWINAVAFSADRHLLAAGGSDNLVRLWDTSTGQVIETLPHPGPVTALAFLDNDHTLATSAADGVVRLWSVPGPLIGGLADSVFSLSYAASGTTLAVSTGGAAGTVELWSTKDPRDPVPLGSPIIDPAGDSPFAGSLGLSPDGRTVAIGCEDGSVQLWDVSDPRHPALLGHPLVAATALVETLQFSPDGTVLAEGGDDSLVRLWNVRQASDPKLVTTLSGPANYVFGVAFSADGLLLAAGSADDKTWLWDLTNPARPQPLPTLTGFSSYVFAVAFSPYGRMLAVGSADKTVRLWDLSDPRHPTRLGGPLTGATNYVYSVAFTPNGQTLIAGSIDHTVAVWDVSQPRQPTLLASLTDAAESVFVVVVSPDGRTIAAGTAEKAVRLWPIDPASAAAEVCAVAGDPITPAEWAQYIPNRPYQPPC